MAAQIKHLIVLMMENRSLDHMLGFMKSNNYAIEGLNGTEVNRDSTGEPVRVNNQARYSGDLGIDPRHDFTDVMEQMFGTYPPAPGQQANMSGFVRNYERYTGGPSGATPVMNCFAPNNLRILTTLARTYAVCDHWFCSVPGPTLANRLYAHAGTTRGRVDSLSPDFLGSFKTVYEVLFNLNPPVSSAIFYEDWTAALSFEGLLLHNQARFFAEYARFGELCRQNKLPSYCFIEPRYNSQTVGSSLPANDQHPDHDVAAGEGFIHSVYDDLRSDFHFRGLYSFTNFYLVEGRYDLRMPAIGQADVTKDHRFEDQIVFSAFVSRVNLAKQDFYGIGPGSMLSGLALYRQLQDKVGGMADWPLLSWVATGATIQLLLPTIKGVSGTSTLSVAQAYGEQGAPGVSTQPSFMNYQGYIRVHTPVKPSQTWTKAEARVAYDRFSDLNSGTFAFGRLGESASMWFDLRRDVTDLETPWWKNALCEPIVGSQCSFGQLAFRQLLTASYVSTNHFVPFYFQPTLGGTDIDGVDTLRGLVDYRLRAPNRILYQAEFYQNIQGPIGIYGFYDVGKVALTSGDLGFAHLRHDVGVGVYFKVENKIVVRGYIGFGAGEGSHPNFKLPSAL